MAKGWLGKIRAFLGKVWDEAAPAAAHGSSEIASVLYTGSGFVQPPATEKATETMAQLQAEAQQKQSAEPEREQGLER
jgi:hypothetical protein